MVRNIIISFLLIFTLSCSNYDEDIYKYIPAEIELNDFESGLIDSINEYRLSIGVNEVISDSLVYSVAKKHCEYMLDNNEISHDNFVDRITILLNNGARDIGENVGYGYLTPNGYLKGYLNSESHRSVIENSKYTHIGVVVLKSEEGRTYNILLFTNFN